jgi:predicted secreted hydrolase
MVKLALLALAWQLALPGWHYEFPRDHGSHPDFKTEWWYFTGNLKAKDGHEFGYQLTFFRQGVIPAGEKVSATSRFVARQFSFAHFAISDLSLGKFFFDQSMSRGTFGEAGFGDGNRLAWIEDSSLELRPDGAFHLAGRDGGKALDLVLRSSKPPAIHGRDGVSQKADGAGRASHYYSFTRLETTGSLSIDGRTYDVTGSSWFDHEWASNQLAADQVGWDWFSLQFDDGSELMLFQLRKQEGGRDHWSGGSFIAADGAVTRIANDDFSLTPSAPWKSPASGGEYPERWALSIPSLQLEASVVSRLKDQELRLSPIAYWEGSISVSGTRKGSPIRGLGYLEMTGYAGRVVGLQAGE